jgi:hypothetical protein
LLYWIFALRYAPPAIAPGSIPLGLHICWQSRSGSTSGDRCFYLFVARPVVHSAHVAGEAISLQRSGIELLPGTPILKRMVARAREVRCQGPNFPRQFIMAREYPDSEYQRKAPNTLNRAFCLDDGYGWRNRTRSKPRSAIRQQRSKPWRNMGDDPEVCRQGGSIGPLPSRHPRLNDVVLENCARSTLLAVARSTKCLRRSADDVNATVANRRNPGHRKGPTLLRLERV